TDSLRGQNRGDNLRLITRAGPAMIDTWKPTCACGYDLTGLDGPPWKCPECGQATLRRPPPPSPLAMTPREARARRWSLVAIGLCPLLAPWVGRVGGTALIVVGGTAIVVFAATLASWLVRGERGAAKLFAVLPFFVIAGCGTGVIAVLLALSAITRSWVL